MHQSIHAVFSHERTTFTQISQKVIKLVNLMNPLLAGISISPPKRETQSVSGLRAHLEEDAGKSTHMNHYGLSGIDLNRAGTPLLEIVSEPDFSTADEVVDYLKKLRQLIRYLHIGDGNMQEGSFRCDVNISLRPPGQIEYGTRCEIKNLNSFRFIKQAIQCEINRQSLCLDNGDTIIQETRQYNPETNSTHSMRSKEEAHDYRYFPDPDLLPVHVTQEHIEKSSRPYPNSLAQRNQIYGIVSLITRRC